ncbi:MAG: NADH:flavin oxidoreductase [Desulfobacterales bacterium]|nr:NADH:flavin oxidoreductase [Desulfobacterales bacterium]
MSKLFEKTIINGMALENRFVRSATWEGMATEDGAVTPRLIDCMVALAEGGVGLIISGHTYVHRAGQAGPWQLGAYSDNLVPGLTDMAAAVHDNGGKIVLQLAHAGFFANAKLSGQTPFAVSDVEGLAKSPRAELTTADIEEIVAAYAAAAARAKTAGFDGVQIHAAHGYLLSQFLSPAFNRRTDDFGGSVENRARSFLAVVDAVQNSVGPDYPVLVKMNCGDFIDNGLTLDDAVAVAKMLVEAGIDAIEVSGGVLTSRKLSPSRMGIHNQDREAYFQKEAAAIKEATGVPLILVGGNRSFDVAERLVNEGTADYISMCRPLIREPDLINRWKSGDRTRATCLSDNQCFGPAMAGEGIYCVTERKEQQK